MTCQKLRVEDNLRSPVSGLPDRWGIVTRARFFRLLFALLPSLTRFLARLAKNSKATTWRWRGCLVVETVSQEKRAETTEEKQRLQRTTSIGKSKEGRQQQP